MIRTNSYPIARTIDGLMKELFNDLPTAVNKVVREDVLQHPPVNIIGKESIYSVEMLVPGYSKSDFKVTLEGNVLTIAAESKLEEINEDEKVIRREFSMKAFKRSFTIDEKIDAEKISVLYENGILKLELPKKEQVKPAVQEFEVK